MLTLHAGMPKTGTSSLQSQLHAQREELADRGIDYPERWTDGRIAHHRLALDLQQSTPADAAALGEQVNAVVASSSGDVLLSTEALTNLITAPSIRRLGTFLDALDQPCTMVVALRPVESFLESTYLHMVKVFDDSPGTIEEFLEPRRGWCKPFFSGLQALRDRPDVDLRLVPYRRGDDYDREMSQAMGLGDLLTILPNRVVRGVRLTLKGQTLLANLDAVGRGLGIELDRSRVHAALAGGALQFGDDTTEYRAIPQADATELRAEALAVAESHGISEYVDAFSHQTIDWTGYQPLDSHRLTDADREAIAAWAAAPTP